MESLSYDIIIVGGGIVGSALACALSQQTSLSIAILEAQSPPATKLSAEYHHRVSAISLTSQRIFKALGVWDAIKQKRVSPFTQMEVWDASSEAKIQFDSRDIAESILGYIIENPVIQAALQQKINADPQITFISPVELISFYEDEHGIKLQTANSQLFQAKLAIAADGANSWLRSQAGFKLQQHDYQQQAIVSTVRTELPHESSARQIFLAAGPLAFLPLDHPTTSSIVWTLPVDEAERVLSLDEDKFKDVLSYAFAKRLGEVIEVEKRYSFPLCKQQAQQYVKARVALVGDAAHVIHPLAGQGINLGLLDIASLVDVVSGAQAKCRDFSQTHTLRQYERWRKADNLTMLASIDMIKKLFASDKKSMQTLRSVGLNMTNRVAMMKRIFTRYAIGNRENLPTLAQPLLERN